MCLSRIQFLKTVSNIDFLCNHLKHKTLINVFNSWKYLWSVVMRRQKHYSNCHYQSVTLFFYLQRSDYVLVNYHFQMYSAVSSEILFLLENPSRKKKKLTSYLSSVSVLFQPCKSIGEIIDSRRYKCVLVCVCLKELDVPITTVQNRDTPLHLIT